DAPHRAAAGRGRLDAQDQGYRDPADALRADDAGGRSRRRRLVHRPRAPLLQHAEDDDLRGLERDPAQHHLQDDPRFVGGDMNFDYNEEQQLLTDSVRRFLGKDYGFEERKKIVASKEGWSAKIWATLAEMGLTGLPFSTEHGGFGGGAVD